MSIFSPPKSAYTEPIDISKFNLAWKVFTFCSIAFIILSVFHIIFENKNLIPSIAGGVVMFLSLLSLKFSKRYTISVIIIAVSGFIINQYTIFTMRNVDRFIDVLWILSVGFYIFYTAGVIWGMINLLINFTGLFFFLIHTPKEVLEHSIANKTFANEVDMAVNALVSLTVISYLLNRLLTEHKISETKLKKSNNELMAQKEQLIKQNEEKTVLLQEVHHRVKNNLQIISSLLRLQAGELDAPEIRDHFEEANNRVRSMALIHEKIYQNQNLAKLDLKDYLKSLTDELIRTYAYQKNIEIQINTTNVESINIKALVPIALIFNELITNTLKHGFSEKESGTVFIDIEMKDNHMLIEYKDDGIWKEQATSNGFGTTLIETFTEQLDGKVELNTTNGVHYKFELTEINEVI